MHVQHARACDIEAAMARNLSAMFDKAEQAQHHHALHADLTRDLERAMHELGAFCDEAFAPHDTHELHAEMRDIAASMRRPDFVSPARLTQFAQLRATVERMWTTRARNALSVRTLAPLTPLAQYEYTRVLLRLDLALVRLKVQVLMRQLED